MKYCINCFKEIENDECPFCGFDHKGYEINNRALQPLTILAGKYMIGKIIGEGGFGITYMAMDLNLKMRVAIKEYFPVQLAGRNTGYGGTGSISVVGGTLAEYFAKGLSNFENEARRLASLERLPGIVHVLNFFFENNTAYMVMEYIPGKSLKEINKENGSSIDWKKVLELIEPVITSLAVVHRNGIIHRDISPDNIMQRDDGRIVLIDFGAARESDNDGKSKTIELKHGYAPPEQYQTHGNQGPWTDVYALCATVYRLISGRVLPDGMSLYTGDEKITPLREFDRSIPAALDTAIMKGLSPHIEERIRDMDELHSYIYGGNRIIPWNRIRHIIMASLIVIVLGVIGVVLFQYAGKKNPSDTLKDTGIKGSEISNGYSGNDPVMDDQADMSEKDKSAKTDSNTGNPVQTDTAVRFINENGLSYTDPSYIETEENNDGLTVISVNTDDEIVIPEEIDGKKVTAVKSIKKGTGERESILSVVLPDTVTRIEANAFKNCIYMERVYLPAGLKEIGKNAFLNCLNLKEIHISAQNEMFYAEDGKIKDKDGNVYFEN